MNIEKVGAHDRRILKIVRHPKFDKNYFDVALVILDQSFVFDEHIQPICLPTEAMESADFMNRYTITVQGWGKDNSNGFPTDLSQVDLTIRNQKFCNSKYDNLPVNTKLIFLPDLLLSSMFCADGNLNPTAGTCYGDSGGPSIIRSVN